MLHLLHWVARHCRFSSLWHIAAFTSSLSVSSSPPLYHWELVLCSGYLSSLWWTWSIEISILGESFAKWPNCLQIKTSVISLLGDLDATLGPSDRESRLTSKLCLLSLPFCNYLTFYLTLLNYYNLLSWLWKKRILFYFYHMISVWNYLCICQTFVITGIISMTFASTSMNTELVRSGLLVLSNLRSLIPSIHGFC